MVRILNFQWHIEKLRQGLDLGARLASTYLVRGFIPPPHLDQPPFSKISSFLEIQDVAIFYKPIGKTKVLRDSF